MKARNAIAIIATASAIVISSCGEGFSVGERSGIVTKLSYKGIINKGWMEHFLWSALLAFS